MDGIPNRSRLSGRACSMTSGPADVHGGRRGKINEWLKWTNGTLGRLVQLEKDHFGNESLRSGPPRLYRFVMEFLPVLHRCFLYTPFITPGKVTVILTWLGSRGGPITFATSRSLTTGQRKVCPRLGETRPSWKMSSGPNLLFTALRRGFARGLAANCGGPSILHLLP